MSLVHLPHKENFSLKQMETIIQKTQTIKKKRKRDHVVPSSN